MPGCLSLLGLAASAGAGVPVVDGHNHDAFAAAGGRIDASRLDALKARGIQVVMVPLPIERSATPDLLTRVAAEVAQLRQVCSQGLGFAIAGEPTALLAGVPAAEVQAFFTIEWSGNLFAGDPSRVRRYRDLGVRAIGLAEEDADGLFAAGEGPAVLSPFGQRILAAMNEAGVLIDITHLSHQQKLAVISHSPAPVVASHSLVQAVTPVAFNLTDEVVTALAARGGSVWVSFNRSDLLGEAAEEAALERLLDHMDVLIARLGPGQVGIGTDLQAAGRYIPAPLNRGDAFAEIRRRLGERGHPPHVVDGVLGGNVLAALAGSRAAAASGP